MEEFINIITRPITKKDIEKLINELDYKYKGILESCIKITTKDTIERLKK